MSGSALSLVLAAALIHAGWNALAKRAHDPLIFLWSSVALASLCLAPLGVWVIVAEGWKPGGAFFVAATVAIHAVYFSVLGRAYAAGDLSLVYPVARGLGVALVPLLALVFLDERPSPLGALGMALVVVGIVAMYALERTRNTEHDADHQKASRSAPGSPERPERQEGSRPAPGPPERPERRGPWGALSRPPISMTWAVATGVTIAAYSIVDKAGVARVHPLAYISLMGVGMSLLLAPFVLKRRDELAHEWRVNAGAIIWASSMNLTSYLLVLYAFRLSKVGYVVATRETSIVFSVLIGSMLMGEGHLGPRLVGALIVLLGVACVALAR